MIAAGTERSRTYLNRAALFIMLLTGFSFFATAIWDIDFWWHIASGKYICSTLSLPQIDPFAMYASTGIRTETVLRAQWLGQSILYATFDRFGPSGIIYLKATVLTLCLVLLFVRARSMKSTFLLSALISFLAGAVLVYFTGERPQLFSFLAVTVLFFLLERYKAGGSLWHLYGVVAMTLTWANLHGSIVLGAVLLVLYALGHLLDRKWGYEQGRPLDRALLTSIGIALLCTVLTPNGVGTYQYILQLEGSDLQSRTSEYMSPFVLAKQFKEFLAPYWLLVLLGCLSAYVIVKGKNYSSALLLVPLLILSLKGWRYIPFFMLVTGPSIASCLSESVLPRFRPSDTLVSSLLIAICIAALASGTMGGKILQHGVMKYRFPEGLVDAARQAGIRGKIFTSLEWGGYVLWTSFPDMVPYIDGRALDMDVFNKYTHILWATPQGISYLHQEDVKAVILPYSSGLSGEEVFPLPAYLVQNEKWAVFYKDKQGYLLVKR